MPVRRLWRAPRLGGALLVEPHVGQVLIEVVTRTDLPSFHVGSQRNDPVPVGDHQLVHFGIEYVLLEIAHQCPLFRSVGLVQHLLVQIDLELVVVVPIVLAEHGMRQVFLDIEKWVHHAVAAGLDDDVEAAAAHRFVPRPRRHHALVNAQSDLAPLVDQPRANEFVRLIDVRFRSSNASPSAPASFKRRLASARDLPMSGQYPASVSSSVLVAASGEPGKTMPPTVFTLAILASAGAPCHWLFASVSARRTRTSSNGFFL